MTPSSQNDLNSVVDADETATDTETVTTTEPTAQPVEDSKESTENSSAQPQTPSLGQSWLYAGGALLAIYGLFASINILNLGFRSILRPPSRRTANPGC